MESWRVRLKQKRQKECEAHTSKTRAPTPKSPPKFSFLEDAKEEYIRSRNAWREGCRQEPTVQSATEKENILTQCTVKDLNPARSASTEAVHAHTSLIPPARSLDIFGDDDARKTGVETGSGGSGSTVSSSSVGSADVDSIRKEVISIYKEYNPSKLSEVESLLSKYSGKENELVARLKSKYVSTSLSFVPTAIDAPGSRVYMEFVDMEGKHLGRVNYRLFDAETPLTAENFRVLCTGEMVRIEQN